LIVLLPEITENIACRNGETLLTRGE